MLVSAGSANSAFIVVASTSVSASSKILTAMSACSRVSTSGGENRTAFLPAPSSSSPRANAALTTASRSSVGALLRLPIAHELDADHQPAAAHVADQRMLVHQRLRGRPSDARRRRRRSRSSRSFSSSIVASAAAHDTGLPPNVLACAPGGHAISPRAPTATPSGMPDAMPFAIAIMSGSTPRVLDREHLPRPSHPRLHFVRDQQDAVRASSARAAAAGTDRARRRSRPRPESARRRSAATSSGETRCDEDLMIDEVEALGRAGLRLRARADTDSSPRYGA